MLLLFLGKTSSIIVKEDYFYVKRYYVIEYIGGNYVFSCGIRKSRR